jgi:hypothetical protein
VRRIEVVIALVLATARFAVAAPSVGVVVTGDPALQNKVRAQAIAWIQQHGFTPQAKPLGPDALKTLTNCFVIEDMECARGVVEHQSTVDYLVFVRADLIGGKRSKEANLVAYWFLKDRDAVVDKRNCKPCVNATLAKTTEELIAAIYDETGLAKSRLSIADPPGMTVAVDGVDVGVTPLDWDVVPGKHEITLRKADTTLGPVSVETKAGEIKKVDMPVKPSVEPPARTPRRTESVQTEPSTPSERPSPSRIFPGLLIVGGLGAIATGGVFVYYGHKNGPDDPLIYPTATRDGAITAGIGGAVLVTGLVLWWHGTAAAQTGPTASITRGGSIVGWAGQF